MAAMFLTVCANPSVDSFWSLDQIQQGTTNRSNKETFYPGGKGIHTAMALNELGQDIITLGVWGGQTGQWLQSECHNKHIKTIGPSVGQWNRICITVDSDSSWDETELLGSGPYVEADTIKDFEYDYQQCLDNNNVSAILMSGSVPRGFKSDTYQKLTVKAKEAEIPVFLDASGPLLKNTLKESPFAVHINRYEGRNLSGKENPPDIARWLGDYCTLAAVTAGTDGLYLAYQESVYHAFYTLDEEKIVSTIGAGDCLLAGLCLATFTHEYPQEWAKFAAACGSANCIYPELGMLQAEDVKRITDQVTLQILEL